MDENLNNLPNVGIVKISDEVVSVIAGLAAGEIKGITGVNNGITGGITQIFSGRKNPSKGIKVNMAENSASIDIMVGVEYGLRIPEVAKSIQENVKKAVETMTGLTVSSVNVYVQNVIIPKNENNLEIEEE